VRTTVAKEVLDHPHYDAHFLSCFLLFPAFSECIPIRRRRKFERSAMLHELCSRAGPSYARHFRRREQESGEAKQRRYERRVSIINPNSLWFDELFYFRVALALNTAIACFFQARILICVTAGGRSTTECVGG
jgi:hypothetical protein